MSEPKIFHPTSEARVALAKRFRLPYADNMQDWEYEVASPDRFDEFLRVYRAADLSDDELVSLMEMMIQCVEEMSLDEAVGSAAWEEIVPLLHARPDLHGPSVEYWARPAEKDPDNLWHVSPGMRKILDSTAK
ncbi:MAG TPA: hypothetical protein VGM81_01930 [Burkholderiaceae bacterium]|jgi:hypothetical protein